MSYIIGSYNIRDFSRESISKKDIETISDIILSESMDIVAIQEVYSNGKAIGSEELGKYKSLLSYLGSNWSYSIKNPSSHQTLNSTAPLNRDGNKHRTDLFPEWPPQYFPDTSPPPDGPGIL